MSINMNRLYNFYLATKRNNRQYSCLKLESPRLNTNFQSDRKMKHCSSEINISHEFQGYTPSVTKKIKMWKNTKEFKLKYRAQKEELTRL